MPVRPSFLPIRPGPSRRPCKMCGRFAAVGRPSDATPRFAVCGEGLAVRPPARLPDKRGRSATKAPCHCARLSTAGQRGGHLAGAFPRGREGGQRPSPQPAVPHERRMRGLCRWAHGRFAGFGRPSRLASRFAVAGRGSRSSPGRKRAAHTKAFCRCTRLRRCRTGGFCARSRGLSLERGDSPPPRPFSALSINKSALLWQMYKRAPLS